jgi:tyrosyl-tRNA synthetase
MVVPDGTPTIQVSADGEAGDGVPVVDLIISCGFAKSKSEARRLVGEKGIRLNGETLTDAASNVSVKSGDVLQRGKRKYAKLEVSG